MGKEGERWRARDGGEGNGGGTESHHCSLQHTTAIEPKN